MRSTIAVCVLLIGVSPMVACDCKPPPAPKKAMEAAAAVCLAEVVSIETEGQERTVTLKVEKWWKGGDKAELVVTTHKSGATCGYGFEKGKTYLVYASNAGEQNKTLRVSLCSRTRTKEQAEKSDDFKELGEGKAPAGK
jgi:hypothetical protein